MLTPFTRRAMTALLSGLALLPGTLAVSAASPSGHSASRSTPSRSTPNRSIGVMALPGGGYLLGNPAARIKLTEYISYTCPHCAHFNEQSEATLRLTFVATAKGSIEIRQYIRDSVDMAAALLVDCGGPTRFVRLHDHFLRTQTLWLARIAGLTDAQRQRWDNGTVGARMRAIAADLGFYTIMDNNGVSRPQADRCLSDEPAMKRLAAQTEAANIAGVTGTPGFAIDGVVLTGTYDWTMLAPQLQARE